MLPLVPAFSINAVVEKLHFGPQGNSFYWAWNLGCSISPHWLKCHTRKSFPKSVTREETIILAKKKKPPRGTSEFPTQWWLKHIGKTKLSWGQKQSSCWLQLITRGPFHPNSTPTDIKGKILAVLGDPASNLPKATWVEGWGEICSFTSLHVFLISHWSSLLLLK